VSCYVSVSCSGQVSDISIIPNAGALDPLSFVVVLGVSIHGSLSRLGGVTDDLVVCMAMYV
jgi:hypothetical protein